MIFAWGLDWHDVGNRVMFVSEFSAYWCKVVQMQKFNMERKFPCKMSINYTWFQRYWLNELKNSGHIIPRHDHLHILRQLYFPIDIGCSHIELRHVIWKESGVSSSTLIFGEKVYLCLESPVDLHCSRLGNDLLRFKPSFIEEHNQCHNSTQLKALTSLLTSPHCTTSLFKPHRRRPTLSPA